MRIKSRRAKKKKIIIIKRDDGINYLCGCRCVFSCRTSGEIFYRSTGTDTASCPNESANALIK